jgi:hypothetical protein
MKKASMCRKAPKQAGIHGFPGREGARGEEPEVIYATAW